VDIQEKKAISKKANTGAYVFPSAAQLKTWTAENLDIQHPDGAEVGEYYTSQVISMMVHNDIPCIGMPIDKKNFTVVGTPEQLQDLLKALKSDTLHMPVKLKTRRFCFDLDMTLVGVPAISGDYSTCPPDPEEYPTGTTIIQGWPLHYYCKIDFNYALSTRISLTVLCSKQHDA
jgi:hypothetical protein